MRLLVYFIKLFYTLLRVDGTPLLNAGELSFDLKGTYLGVVT